MKTDENDNDDWVEITLASPIQPFLRCGDALANSPQNGTLLEQLILAESYHLASFISENLTNDVGKYVG